jgi:catechol 2,3-dioxygenase-like lactoylglutathione lyase family enzyme
LADRRRRFLDYTQIVCFSATKDAEAARDFYENVLGMNFVEDSPFALVFDMNGTTLRIQKVPDHTPAKHTSLGWEVSECSEGVVEDFVSPSRGV